jgi:hypothetical protein
LHCFHSSLPPSSRAPVEIAPPPETVFDVVATPYLGRTPGAWETLEVLERGTDMVLAAQYTPLGRRLTASTVETVRFERPERAHASRSPRRR